MEENLKSKNTSRVKERRQHSNQDDSSKKNNLHQRSIKKDLSQLLPTHLLDVNSPAKKIFSEATKIVKIGMDKDYALIEKDTTLQNSNETIDNLRRNMLHLQMEYEKLDQNFQREVSYRSDIAKRMDATRELVESVVQCSNVLAGSIKQLESDKFKITEFYEVIYQNQGEVQAKHAQTESFIKEQNEIIKEKMREIEKNQKTIASQNSEVVPQLNRELHLANERLKAMRNENEKLEKKIHEFQESSTKFETFLEQQEKLNCLHQESMIALKQNLTIMRAQRCKYQKLLKNNKKRVLMTLRKNKNLTENLKEVKLLNKEIISINQVLEVKVDEWKGKYDEHLEDDAKERGKWEAEKQKIIDQLTEKESEVQDLRKQKDTLLEKISEFSSSEKAKRMEFEEIQNDLSKMLRENLKLKEDVTKLNEENNDKAKIISELEIKTKTEESSNHSQAEFYKKECEKLQKIVKEFEIQTTDLQKTLVFEKAEKENALSQLRNKLDETSKLSDEKVSLLEQLLEEEKRNVQKLEYEKSNATLNSKLDFEKLNKELQEEKLKNQELIKNLEKARMSYEDVNEQLAEAKNQISDHEKKILELNSLNNSLNITQAESEKKATDLKRDLECDKKSFVALEEKYKKAEKELTKMRKLTEENVILQSSTADLKNRLEITEARMEAYRVVVKKLENEKAEFTNSHFQEVSKLKLELKYLEEALKKDKIRLETPHKSKGNTSDKNSDPPSPEIEGKSVESMISRKPNQKELEPEVEGTEKWYPISTPPFQGGKKFLSTPRKVVSSTPQSKSSRNTTSTQKKRDPYEFDSDSSVERVDQNKVLKVFNRQKRSKTNK